jgi:hypothetical protein
MTNHHRTFVTVRWASLAALAVATATCGTNRRNTASVQTGSATPVTTAETPATQPVSLTGCLQEGNHGSYILTELNSPKHPDSSDPAVVAREKLAAAGEAYVLSTDKAPISPTLVGDRVHVEGILARASDLPGTHQTSGDARGAAGRTGELKAVESGRLIKEGDLAEIRVNSVQKVAGACGTHAAGLVRRSK